MSYCKQVDDAISQAQSLYLDLGRGGVPNFDMELRVSVAVEDDEKETDVKQIFVKIIVRDGFRVNYAMKQVKTGEGLSFFNDDDFECENWNSRYYVFHDVIYPMLMKAVEDLDAEVERRVAERISGKAYPLIEALDNLRVCLENVSPEIRPYWER